MFWGEDHISHNSRVLRRFHPQQYSSSCEFRCRQIICLEQFVFSWSGEKFACLHEPQFGRISLNIYFRISIKTKKLPARVLNSLFNDLISYQMWPGLCNNHAAYRDIPVNEQCYVWLSYAASFLIHSSYLLSDS